MICRLIIGSLTGENPNEHLISVDEKTGIQALERKKTSRVDAGKVRKIEYEYERHGTTCLMGGLNVSSGKLEHYRIHPSRKEEDFLIFIKKNVYQFLRQTELYFLLTS